MNTAEAAIKLVASDLTVQRFMVCIQRLVERVARRLQFYGACKAASVARQSCQKAVIQVSRGSISL